MAVFVCEDGKYFQIDTKKSTYLIGVAPGGFLGHMYYGEKLRLDGGVRYDDLSYLLGEPLTDRHKVNFEDSFPWEYGMPGYGDFRKHCLEIEAGEGKEALEFCYAGYELLQKKPDLQGLPGLFGEDGETLLIRLRERKLPVTVELVYRGGGRYCQICPDKKRGSRRLLSHQGADEPGGVSAGRL